MDDGFYRVVVVLDLSLISGISRVKRMTLPDTWILRYTCRLTFGNFIFVMASYISAPRWMMIFH